MRDHLVSPGVLALVLLPVLACNRPAPADGGAPVAPSPGTETPAPSAPRPSVEATATAASRPAHQAIAASPVVQLSIGHYRACALRADGRVVCWGEPMLTDEPVPPAAPTLVAGLDDATQIDGDDPRWCAVRKGGGIACWDGSLAATPAGIPGAVEVSERCARLASGKVSCWEDVAGKPVPREVAGIAGARALGHGRGETCVVTTDRAVWCWGTTVMSLRGGPAADVKTPRKMKQLSAVDEVGTSFFSPSCARSGGTVKCWGGEGSKSPAPTALPGISDAVQIAVGEYHACVRSAKGTIACFGANASNQIGLKAPTPEAMGISVDKATIVDGVSDAVEVAVGGGEPCGGCGSTCVRKKDGAVLCWGAINKKESPAVMDLTPAAR